MCLSDPFGFTFYHGERTVMASYKSVEVDMDAPYGDWKTFKVGKKDPRKGRSNATVTEIIREGSSVIVKFDDRRNFSVSSSDYRHLR